MNCMKCSKSVTEKDAKFFLNVFLCSTCASSAEKARNRMRSELEALLSRVDASFRKVLSSDTLNFSLHDCAVADRKTMLELSLKLDEMTCCQDRTSQETTKPSALTADGSRSSASLRAAD